MTILHQAEREFRDWFANQTGAIPPRDIVPGELFRVDDPEAKRGNKALYGGFYADSIPAGYAGNFRTGLRATWVYQGQPVSAAEQEQARRMMQSLRTKRERERQEKHRQAAQRAANIWDSATHATMAHPYLARKKTTALGLRQRNLDLVVPLRLISGELVSLQFISGNGDKLFLTGGRIAGAFFQIGTIDPEGSIYIAEGAATAAAVYSTVNRPVLAAMNAGNLRPVAEIIRKTYPAAKIVFAADDDHRTNGNPGITKAVEAARAVGGMYVSPIRCDAEDCTCTDFADTAICWRAPR